MRRAAAGKQLVLAVSGGRDSMALLHAMARAARESIAMVATFDHATGPAAARAAAHVAAEAARLRLPVVVGRADHAAASEAEWRDQRLRFLAQVAGAVGGARVVLAHTRDDQVETVLMRVLRDAGARGLAGLYASTGALRPLLEFSRADVAGYARAVGATRGSVIRWVDDPANASPRFLRNRVRRDLLPALRAVSPSLERQLLALARDAARVRRRADAAINALVRFPMRRGGADGVAACVDARTLTDWSDAALAVLWQSAAARAGLAMDWRGTERAVAFTRASRPGRWMPLSGGWRIARARHVLELHPPGAERAVPPPLPPTPLERDTRWMDWRFVATPSPVAVSDEWMALLPAGAPLAVRRWAPGDRMRLAGSRDARKVKRFLSDAHVSGARRLAWPVVLAGDEIVWIPGVRRSDAAAVRPGRPGVLYRCEFHDR